METFEGYNTERFIAKRYFSMWETDELSRRSKWFERVEHAPRELCPPLDPISEILETQVFRSSWEGTPFTTWPRISSRQDTKDERDEMTSREPQPQRVFVYRAGSWGGLLCTWPTCGRPAVTREAIEPTRVSSRRIGFDLEPNRK